MDTCYYCGEPVEFRYVGGAVAPIHISGNWCPAASGGLPPKKPPAAFTTYDSYVNPNASCPVCGDRVFFYQSPHGGRVFFDDLGWPWPKHPCTDNPRAASGHVPSRPSSTGLTALRDRQGVIQDFFVYRSHESLDGARWLIVVKMVTRIGLHRWVVKRKDMRARGLVIEDLVNAPSFTVGRNQVVVRFINARGKEVSELPFEVERSPDAGDR